MENQKQRDSRKHRYLSPITNTIINRMSTQHYFPLTLYLLLLLVSPVSADAQPNQFQPSREQNPKSWIFEGTTDGITGLGVADYSRFNPEKAWREALQNGVEDLNANHSLLVYYHGRKIGRGPLRTESEYAIRNFLDTTQVSIIDSTIWKERAFVLVEPNAVITDSILYPDGQFRAVTNGKEAGRLQATGGWITINGATPRIDSNWHMSITKAKQDALRQLAEDLAVEVSTETYQKDERTRRYYNFSTMFAFQRIHVLKRTFSRDSVKVTVAVRPQEIKMLMEE